MAGDRIIIADDSDHHLVILNRDVREELPHRAPEFGKIGCLSRIGDDELLVCDGAQFVRIGLDLAERSRTPAGYDRITNAMSLGSGRIAVGDANRKAVVTIDRLGNELSVIPVHFPSAFIRLSSGNLLVADGTSLLKEFDSDGRIVHQTPLESWAASLDVSPSGEMVVGESRGYESFDAHRVRLWSRPSQSRVSCVQQLANNEVFLCEPDAHRLVIVDHDGSVVWEWTTRGTVWHALVIQ